MTRILTQATDARQAMSRPTALIHAAAGAAAILIILAFQTATIMVEGFGDATAVAAVKTAIWYAIPLLVLAMAAAGGSGNWLARGNGSTLVRRKRLRMALAAANGLLVLIPCAYLLQRWASTGSLDARFYAVQSLEIAAGLGNLTLLILNAVDGRKLAGRGARPRAPERVAS